MNSLQLHSTRKKDCEQVTDNSDAQLMRLIQARSEPALETLFRRYLSRGIRRAQHTGLDYQTAEDIVAEAFIKIWNQAEKFQAMRGSFSGWFYAIVHNLAIDELRRTQARSNAQVKAHLAAFDPLGSDKDYLFLQELDQIQVRNALTQLPETQQLLLRLAYIEGLSRREIAKRLALPVGTVHTRVRLGKEKLKRLLQEPKRAPAFEALAS